MMHHTPPPRTMARKVIEQTLLSGTQRILQAPYVKAPSLKCEVPAKVPSAPSSKLSETEFIARRKQLELKAARAQAQIQSELIEKQLDADIAALEVKRSSHGSRSRRSVVSSVDVEHKVEEWMVRSNLDAVERPLASGLQHEAPPPPPADAASTHIQHFTNAMNEHIATSITAATKCQQTSPPSRPAAYKQDLPSFYGDRIEWLTFTHIYMESTNLCKYTDAENLLTLRHCLRGEAKKTVDALLMSSTSAATVFDALELQYGRPKVIFHIMYTQLEQPPPLPSAYHADLVTFSIKNKNFVAATQSIKVEYLRSPEFRGHASPSAPQPDAPEQVLVHNISNDIGDPLPPSPSPPPSPPPSSPVDVTTDDAPPCATVANTIAVSDSVVLLKIVPVTLHGPKGVVTTSALLDDGATVSLIASDIADSIGLNGTKGQLHTRGVWDSNEITCTAETIGIIGGSGFDDPDLLEQRQERAVSTPYGAPSDVIVEGQIKGVPCALLARHGRKHTLQPSDINYRANIWALKQVGCTHVLATTATGSLREDYKPGDLVVLDDFIDRTWSRPCTFYDNSTPLHQGVCHLPMRPAFCEVARSALVKAARDVKDEGVHERGTAVVIQGPRFSSRAESVMHRQWGGDLVNMTTVPEVVLAKEAGLSYAALALVTDYDCWKEGQTVSVTEVLDMFSKNVEKAAKVIIRAAEILASGTDFAYLDQLQATVSSSVMLKK